MVLLAGKHGNNRRLRWALAAAASLASVSCGGWLLWPLPSARQTLPAQTQARTASEAEILDAEPGNPSVFRLASNSRVLVLKFATLRAQGRALDRVAAMVEKAGLPRDRVLANEEPSADLTGGGAAPSSYYYGHDYRAGDLARFFAAAARDHVRLTAEEEQLRALVRQEGWTDGHAEGALVSVFAGAEADMQSRAVVLRHELSHGEYFSNPSYASFVRRFWDGTLTSGERASFRRFLAAEGYDAGLEDLMMNEMQAYLVHTRDPRFFSARDVGIPEIHLRTLRMRFRADMPHGWLRDATPGALAGPP